MLCLPNKSVDTARKSLKNRFSDEKVKEENVCWNDKLLFAATNFCTIFIISNRIHFYSSHTLTADIYFAIVTATDYSPLSRQYCCLILNLISRMYFWCFNRLFAVATDGYQCVIKMSPIFNRVYFLLPSGKHQGYSPSINNFKCKYIHNICKIKCSLNSLILSKVYLHTFYTCKIRLKTDIYS